MNLSRIIKVFILFSGIVGLTLLIALNFLAPQQVDFKFPTNRLWLHRANTLASLDPEVIHTVGGIEADVWFVDNEFFVAHDIHEISLKYPLTDHLSALQKINPQLVVWIDLKNLDSDNVHRIRENFLKLQDNLHLKDKILIESKSYYGLFQLCRGQIKCSLWYYQTESKIKNFLLKISAVLTSYAANISMFSMDVEHMSGAPDQILRSNIGVFTVNKLDVASELKNNKNVKIILSDNPQTLLGTQ